LNFSLRNIRKVQEDKEGSEFNGTCQILICADDVNFLDKVITITKENAEFILDT
jgi:hypothetical protein